MPRRKTQFLQGHYYHIYNRGAGREPIFFNEGNYAYCLRLVKKYMASFQVTIIAYCLMPNHYHFLLRQNGVQPLFRFVSAVFNAYVQAVNRQQARSGTLFEGRFQDVHVDRDGYLLYLCTYIHGNPVKAGLVADPGEWPYSNFLEWVGERPGTLVDHNFVNSCFPNRKDYKDYVLDYLRGAISLPKDIKAYLFERAYQPPGGSSS